MDVRKFVLSYYNNATEDFHIHNVKSINAAGKPHTHEYFQIYYVKKGRILHFLGEDEAYMQRGDMFIVPPAAVHYVSAEEGSEFYSLSFMPSFLCDSAQSPRLVSDFLGELLSSSELKIRAAVSLPSDELSYTDSLIERIDKEFCSKPIGYHDSIRAMTALLVLCLARHYYSKVEESGGYIKENKEIVRHCIEYVEKSYFDSIKIADISKHFAMSTSSFCKIFLSETGYTFNNYLNRIRIERACEYIAKGYKLTALYSLVGYNDFSTFYRNFKKRKGMSPAEYKRRLETK